MIKYLINRPIAVFTATTAVLILALVASFSIPISLVPDIDVPKLVVQIEYPNIAASELEQSVVKPLRDQLLQTSNLKDIKSESRDGIANIFMQFNYGANVDFALLEANEKVDAAMNGLPKEVKRPKVIKASLTDIPILNLTVSLREEYSEQRFLELSEFTRAVLKKRMEQMEDIAIADISGTMQSEIIVRPDIDKLRAVGLSSDDVIKQIRQSNLNLGNVVVNNGAYKYDLKLTNPLQTVNDIKDIYLNANGRVFQLGELAQVKKQPRSERGMALLNGKRAIVLSIIKQSDARIYDLKEKLDDLVKNLESEYPELEFIINQDQSKILKTSIDNLRTSLLIGGLFAFLILFLFIREIRSPLIISITIPIALLLSILMLYLFNFSINIISLSGLILGVGMMIDNSIIVIDNITQKLDQDYSLLNACVAGTREVVAPLVSSMLTTCSVFLPLVYLSGLAGALFFDQAIAVTLSLVTSLIVAITLIPVLFFWIKDNKYKDSSFFLSGVLLSSLEKNYEISFSYFMKKKWIVYLISVASIVLIFILAPTLTYEQLPKTNENELIVKVDWNQNINVVENRNRLDKIFNQFPNFETIFSQIGEQQYVLKRQSPASSSEAEVYLKIAKSQELTKTESILILAFKEEYPSAVLTFTPPKTVLEYLFGSESNDLLAQIQNRNNLEVPEVDQLSNVYALMGKSDFTKIQLDQTYLLTINYTSLITYQVLLEDLLQELKSGFGHNFVDELKTSQKSIPVILSYKFKSIETSLRELTVTNNKGNLIPVNQLVSIRPKVNYKTITADQGGQYLGLSINTEGDSQAAINELDSAFKSSKDFDIRFAGSWFEKQDLQREILLVALVVLILLYLIMAAQFESFWQPLIILFEIPIDLGGAFLFLWLFGQSVNIMSMIGMIVMSGIIINDSILKIHTINMLRKNGLNLKEAILTGGKLRLKSIVMTSLTTILALAPFLFISGAGASLQKPLSLAIIGGLVLGTFISLYFIPVVYYAFAKQKEI